MLELLCILLGISAFLVYLIMGHATPVDVEESCNLFVDPSSRQISQPASTAATPTSQKIPKLAMDPTLTDAENIPGASELFATLKHSCLPIKVEPENISFLDEPAAFFKMLKTLILNAESSIYISALYVGSGPLATEFVQVLLQRLRARPELKVTLLLDRNRMEHSSNLVTVSELVTSFPHRVEVALFQAPSRLSRFVPYSRAREILGVQHTKIFAFDDKHILLTGANLSDDYFTTRIDRYVVLRDSPAVTFWFAELVKTLCLVSHKVVGAESVVEGRPRSPNPLGSFKHKKSGLIIRGNTCGADPSKDKDEFCKKTRAAIDDFAQRVSPSKGSPTTPFPSQMGDNDTYIFPTLQFGRIGIHHDSSVVGHVLKCTDDARVYLSSPYLHIYRSFVDVILKSTAHFHLVTASTATNGWRGQRGFAGYIPFFYLQLERSFYYLMEKFGAGNRVWIHEYAKPGATFHSKGLWISPRSSASETPSSASPSKAHTAAASMGRGSDGSRKPKAPFATAIGSTNYGYRSVDKDVEAEVFLITSNAELRAKMESELDVLFKPTKVVDENRFTNGADGRFQPVVSLVAQLGQGFL